MKRTRNPDQKRQQIIEATQRILRNGGYFTRFSIAKVAKEAGVSKGGLLHHFPDKESLLRGASEEMINRFEDHLDDHLTAETDTPGRFTRAYVRAGLLSDDPAETEVSPVLLAFLRSAATEGDVQGRFNTWHGRTEADGIDVVTATIIRLAVDGLLYTEIIDSEQIDPALRKQVVERLLAMTAQQVEKEI